MTVATQLVLWALLDEPSQERYGLQICEATGLPSGTVHPILDRLDGFGWLESRRETATRRHYYRLTPAGAEHARRALAAAPAPARLAWPSGPRRGDHNRAAGLVEVPIDNTAALAAAAHDAADGQVVHLTDSRGRRVAAIVPASFAADAAAAIGAIGAVANTLDELWADAGEALRLAGGVLGQVEADDGHA
jgi:DNA-binding MarR family transcriptional regulator